MEFPHDLKYTSTHEWIRMDGNRARVGVTSFAAQELSDVVYVDLPEVGKEVQAGQEVSVVESVKAASSIYAPLAGRVADVNTALKSNPALLNESCYQEGWIFELELTPGAPAQGLLTSKEYLKTLEGEK
ncbi:MAG: glycine cleavage system protein GcvH [Candidatus Omnitrophica bacterium]|nr:glycine cleavage system protein GcvH [Candidatus Omnitrophota bacterium]